MSKDAWLHALEQVMEEHFPDHEYCDLDEPVQIWIGDMATRRMVDNEASKMDAARERRKYGTD